jgi:hypothetical protein
MSSHVEAQGAMVTDNADDPIGEVQLIKYIDKVLDLAVMFSSTGPDNYDRKMSILISWLKEALQRAQVPDRARRSELDGHGEDDGDSTVDGAQYSAVTLARAGATSREIFDPFHYKQRGDLRPERDRGGPHPRSSESGKQLGANRRCNHEPDWDRAGITDGLDNWCELGLRCRRCGEGGFSFITPDRIRWNN